MITKTLLAAVTAALIALPAVAQTADKEKNGHHYSGGPKTEVPHHMGPKEAVGSSKKTTSGGHHYTGGPSTSNPHHMGDKDK
ncbi:MULTISPECIES: hypothetical protein [Bradyrhizobium]|uniref:hypothetical protein n=1 Tax=Bradyrhizobium TaxID=374 RepID=UPI0003FB581A|nr:MULTISPECIES: hypothetical protein [Bradyrhizobium]UFW46521.1 hypothetical protein BaraCB756_30045 [Bradyrhizobium arachidis]